MTTAMMTNRLLWKEFRVLRLVWLMCVIGVAALMLLVTVISESQSHPMDYAPALWGFAIWVPPVYILAALATMFAGEREEGTLVWLSVLAPPSGRLMVTKLAYVILTGAMLQGSLAVVAALLSQFDGNDHSDGVIENLFVMSFLLVESVVWGWFWSLQTSKPLNAILYAAISLIAVNLGSIVITEELGYRYSANWNGPWWGNALGFWGWGRLILYTVVVTVSAQVCDRWLAGRPWDWGFVVRWWAAKRTTKTQDIAALEPQEPWQREWQRLRWLEWQALRPFAWMIGTAALLAAVSLLFGEHPTPAAASIFCWLVPLVAGLMSWQGEQSQAQYRTLGLRGASSTALWWNKLAMWALAALAGAAFISLSNACCWHLLWFLSGGTRWSSVIQGLTHTPQPYRTTGEIFGSILAYGATQYALAFTCAHLMKKTVVALGSTLIGTLVLTIWFYTCLGYGLPLWYFLAPIPLWLLWISASYLPAWWVENSTWRVSRRRGGELALLTLFPVGLLSLSAGYRVWEVPIPPELSPEISRLFVSSPALIDDPAANTREWEVVAKLMREMKPPTAETIRRVVQFEAPNSSGRGIEKVNADSDASPPTAEATTPVLTQEERWECELEQNLVEFEQLRDQVLRVEGMAEPSAIYTRKSACVPLVIAALKALEQGDQIGSLRYLKSAARLTGALHRYAPLGQQVDIGRVRDPAVFDYLIRWAQHPRQTLPTLLQGLNSCADELHFWRTLEEEIDAQYVLEYNAGYPGDWPWEAARRRRLAKVARYNRLLYLRAVIGTGRPTGFPSRDFPIPTRYPAIPGPDGPSTTDPSWNFSEPDGVLTYFGQHCLVLGLDRATTRAMHDSETHYRATVTMMALVGYRRLHGQLPTSLDLVADWFSGSNKLLIDPWSGVHFGYEPQGFPLREPHFVPASKYRQPLLWTAGPERLRLLVNENQISGWSDTSDVRVRSITSDATRVDVPFVFVIPPPVAE